MADIAQLGIAVDSSQVTKGANELRAFESVARRTGETVDQVQARFGKLNSATGPAATQTRALTTASQPANDQLVRMAANADRTNTSMTRLFGFTIGAIAARVTRDLVSYAYNLNKTLADTADTADRVGISYQKMQGLGVAASNKGVSGSDLNAGMLKFNEQLDLARNGLGSLGVLLRTNGKSVSDTATTFGVVANMVKNAGSEAQKFSILQQAGLPASREFVKLMEQGADKINQQADAAQKLSDQQLEDAKRLNDRWNELWTSFEQRGKKAMLEIFDPNSYQVSITPGSPIDKVIQTLKSLRGFSGLSGGANDYIPDSGIKTPVVGPSTALPAVKPPGPTTIDPEILKAQISLEQQRLGILGPLATAESVVRQKQLELNAAALNNVGVSKQQADALKLLALAQFEVTRIQQQAQVGVFNLDAANKAAADTLKSWIAQKLVDPTNAQQMAAANVVLAKSTTQLGDAAKVAATPFEGLQRLINEGSNIKTVFDQTAVTSLNGVENALVDITTGTTSAADGFKNMSSAVIRAIEDMIVKMMIITPLAKGLQGFLGGFGGIDSVGGSNPTSTMGINPVAGAFSFAAADGGTFGAGWGVVGERGPELINVHSRGVTVIPNHISKPFLPGFADGGMLGASGNVTRLPFGQNNAPNITIINQTGVQATAQTQTGPDGDMQIVLKKMVEGIVSESVASGDVGRTISKTFGAKKFAGQ
jgi:hypothetical protein